MPPAPMAPKSVDPSSWEWRPAPGTDQGPLCTRGAVMVEQTVVCRWARSVGARWADLASWLSTTDWDEPVSTTKSWGRPAPRRTGTESDVSPGANCTVIGTVVPTSPSVNEAGSAGPVGPWTCEVALMGGPSGPGSVRACAEKSMRTAPKRLQDIGAQQANPAGLEFRSLAASPPSASGPPVERRPPTRRPLTPVGRCPNIPRRQTRTTARCAPSAGGRPGGRR